MFVQDQPLNIQRSNNFEESDFKIKASAKAFQILSSKLYSDKVSAVLRELGTNAADSHVAAGKTKEPFIVHLPNNFEPYLSIKDNGVGLSPKQMEIYKTYFDSDKTNSNDFTGCLGLGSKSPFSLVDSFNICSRYNGTKYTYTAFIKEDGTPTTALMSSEKTAECNGVEITIPIADSQSFSAFTAKAEFIYSFFDVRPTIIGNSNFEFFEFPNLFLEGKDWKLFGIKNESSYAIMGNVAYRIAPKYIVEYFGNNFRFSVNMHFKIGELDIVASREDLDYTECTVNAIKEKCFKVVESAKAKIQNNIDSQKTFWDVSLFINERTKTNSLFFASNIIWKNKNIKYRERCVLTDNFTEYFYDYSYRARKEIIKKIETSSFIIENTIHFIVNDIKRGGKSKTKYFLSENLQYKNCYLITPEQKKEIIKEFEAPENKFTLASTLPSDPNIRTTQRVQKNKNIRNVYVWNKKATAFYREKRNYWDVEEIDIRKGGIYIPIENFETVDRKFCDLPRILRAFNNIGYSPTIYGFTPSQVDKFVSKGPWLNFSKISLVYFTDYFNKIKKEFNEYYYLKEKVREQDEVINIAQFISDENSPFKIFANNLTEISKTSKLENYNDIITLRRIFCINDTFVSSIENEYDDIIKIYPLFKLLQKSFYSFAGAHINRYKLFAEEYVRRVDKELLDG